MSAIFRFSPTTSVAISKFSKINELSKGNFASNCLQANEDAHVDNKPDENTSTDEKKEDKNPNKAIIKLLENKRNDLKKSIETLSNQLRTHIRHVEYIDSRICELKGENLDFQSSRLVPTLRLDPESYQTSISRLSTTINTGINTPNSEPASSNEASAGNTSFHYKMEDDWIIVPNFEEIVSRTINYP